MVHSAQDCRIEVPDPETGMKMIVSAFGVVLLSAAAVGLLSGCATPPKVRKAGAIFGTAAVDGTPAGAAEQAARDAVARFEKRRPYLAGEIFHTLDPIPLVVFVDDPFGVGEIEPFSAGTGPQVEYYLRIEVFPPTKDRSSVGVKIKLLCRYDAVEGDAGAYDEALRAFRDRVFDAFGEELKRAGEVGGVEWKHQNL
jgi:hypothetical protein